jgi:putative membrane protein
VPAGPVVPLAVPVLATLAVLAEIGYPLVHGPARSALTAGTVVVCCAASVGHAALTRGARVGWALVAAFALGGWLSDAVGVATGVPFGAYRYAGSLGPAVLGVPVVVGLAWCMAAWPAYVAARWLAPGLPRAVRVPVAAAALAAWDLFLDPQMVAEGHWTWRHPSPALPGVPGVPLSNYAGWLLAALVLMAAFEALAGRAAARPGRDAVPLALYLWTYCSSVLAHAWFFGLPGSAVWGGVGMGLVAVPLAVTLLRRRRCR